MLIYATTAMVALLAIASLAVDLGRVQLAKTELMRSTDAVARAAAVYLPSDTAGARAAAISIAAANTVDGQPLVLQSGDVVFGKWDAATGVLDTSSITPNAVRITAYRTAARGNPIQLPMAAIIGRSTLDISFTQTTTYSGPIDGIIGLSSFYANGKLFVASYDSSLTTAPTTSSYRTNALLRSNGNVRSKSDGDLYGTLSLGPSGSRTSLVVHGTETTGTTNIDAPTSPAWSPAANPGGISQNYTATGTVTLATGTYYFTTLNVNGDLLFSGPATIYINGNVTFNDSADIRAYGNVPSNLKIYIIGTRTFGSSTDDHIDIVADIEAPSTTVNLHNDCRIYGRMIADTITVNDNAQFYYDEQLGTSTATSGTVTTTK